MALITFTRDRLDYTRHCFKTLEENAGCDYEHFILDQASTDGTTAWLAAELRKGSPCRHILFSKKNIGICAGANRLLDQLDPSKYDVIVRYDNDCEVTQPDTLRICAELAATYGAIVSPRVNGLNSPPETLATVSLGGTLVDQTRILGGIFMAIPAFAFDECGYRYDETSQFAAGDEKIVPWWRSRGGVCGYVQGLTVNHFETTEGQKTRYPGYQERKEQEMVA